MIKEIMHIGVPTDTPKENEMYLEGMKVYVTDPEKTDFKFEYLRFDEDSWMAEEIKKNVHVAIKVDSIEEELKKCDKVLLEPVNANEHLRICFAMKDGAVLELCEDI